MPDFNELPLEEKIQQAKKGDVVVTDVGVRLPSVGWDCLSARVRISSTAIDLPVPYESITDIIRPSEKQEVPNADNAEIAEGLLAWAEKLQTIDYDKPVSRMTFGIALEKLAKALTKGARK